MADEKRKEDNIIHLFSFGERFDEKMLRAHSFGGQIVMLFIHHFIGFSHLNKSAVGTAAQSMPACPCADMQSCRHNGTEYHIRLAKRERHLKTADTAAGFWEQKAIAY